MTNDNDETGVTRRRCLPKLRVAVIPLSLRRKWIQLALFFILRTLLFRKILLLNDYLSSCTGKKYLATVATF